MHMVLTGSLAIDRIMNFPGLFKEHILPDKVHSLNVSFNISQYQQKRGGTAGNIAYTLALLGERPFIVASAGNDFGQYLQDIASWGLDTSGIELSNEEVTASAHIITDQGDNQITGFIMGAMAQETRFRLVQLEQPNQSIVMLSPGNKNDMLRYAQEAKERYIRTVFDPGQTLPFLEPDEIRTLLNGAYMLIVNDYELHMMLNRTNLTEAQIRKQVQVMVVTLGKKGSVIYSEQGEITIPTCPAKRVVDPTGAGDAYRAGMLKAFANNLSLEVAGRMGSVAAAYAIEQYGTQEHSFTLESFKTRYKKAFNEACPIT